MVKKVVKIHTHSKSSKNTHILHSNTDRIFNYSITTKCELHACSSRFYYFYYVCVFWRFCCIFRIRAI